MPPKYRSRGKPTKPASAFDDMLSASESQQLTSTPRQHRKGHHHHPTQSPQQGTNGVPHEQQHVPFGVFDRHLQSLKIRLAAMEAVMLETAWNRLDADGVMKHFHGSTVQGQGPLASLVGDALPQAFLLDGTVYSVESGMNMLLTDLKHAVSYKAPVALCFKNWRFDIPREKDMISGRSIWKQDATTIPDAIVPVRNLLIALSSVLPWIAYIRFENCMVPSDETWLAQFHILTRQPHFKYMELPTKFELTANDMTSLHSRVKRFKQPDPDFMYRTLPRKDGFEGPSLQDHQFCLQVQRLRDDAILPQQGTDAAAGFDLRLPKGHPDVLLRPMEQVLVGTGLAMRFPRGMYGEIKARSNMVVKSRIDVGAGIIDADYRGEVKVLLQNENPTQTMKISGGRPIGQLLLRYSLTASVQEVEDITDAETTRGGGGFGSTLETNEVAAQEVAHNGEGAGVGAGE